MTLPSIGDVVDDKFRIERKLGEGGTSTIFEVRHSITDKKFAIKWLAPELAQNELAVELFIHEARVCGRFEHPNAVQIYDICQTEDSYYMLMEFLEGESLETRLGRVERFSAQAACDIVLPCTEALSAAHGVGIVHQDLKPSNIFLCTVQGRAEEVPKVLDFGISNLIHNGRDLSPIAATTQTVSGTPLYMAPEQMRGAPADPRIDIYALGVVLYELVAGQPPFDSDTFTDLVARIVESQPVRLDRLVKVESAFAEIVARAMAGSVADRFATMADFARALRPYGSQSPSPVLKPVEARRSDVPRAPVRSMWKTTRPGIVVVPAHDAHDAHDAQDAQDAQDVASVGSEPDAGLASDVLVAEGEPTATAVSGDAVDASDADSAAAWDASAELAQAVAATAESGPSHVSPVESEPPAEPEDLGAFVEDLASLAAADARANTANAQVAPEGAASDTRGAPEAADPAPSEEPSVSIPATGSSPRVPPITLPPPSAAAGPMAAHPSRVARALVDDVSVDEDVFVARPHLPRSRWIGVAVALSGALFLTWHSLVREPEVEPPPPVITGARPSLESDTTAARTVQAPSDLSNRLSDEPVFRPQPQLKRVPESEPTVSDTQREKVARRAGKSHSSKRSAASKEGLRPPRRQTGPSEGTGTARADRSGSDTRSGLALPAAELSRQDF